MALTYVTSSVADVSTVLSHSSGALVTCSESSTALLPVWIPLLLPLIYWEIPFSWQGPAQVCLFNYSDSNSSSFQLVSQNPKAFGFRNLQELQLRLFFFFLWYLCYLIMKESFQDRGLPWSLTSWWFLIEGQYYIQSVYECTRASFTSVIRDLIYRRGSTCNLCLEKCLFNGKLPDVTHLTIKVLVESGLIVAQFTCRYNQTFGELVGNDWVLQRA